MLVCAFFSAFAHEIAGAACTRSSLRPSWDRLRPLLRVACALCWARDFLSSSGATRGEIAELYLQLSTSSRRRPGPQRERTCAHRYAVCSRFGSGVDAFLDHQS